MSELSKQALKVDNNQSFPNNNAGAITPSILRAFNVNMIDSNVNQTDFDTFSSSVASEIANITGSGGTIATGSFATTGSNTFVGNQNISASIVFPNGAQIRGNAGQSTVITSSTNLRIESDVSMGIQAGMGNLNISGSNVFIQNLRYPNFDGTAGQVLSTDGAGILTFTTTGSFATTGSNTFTGNQTINGDVIVNPTTKTTLNGNTDIQNFLYVGGGLTLNTPAEITWVGVSGSINSGFSASVDARINAITGSGGGGTSFSNPNLVSNSGSLFIVGNTFFSGAAELRHISSSTQTLSNLVFKNNNNTANTIVSGSGNIFTNPNFPAGGYIKYVGGANNLYLNNANGINSEITASATSVSGNRPIMNNNIFQGTAALFINQAPNGGTHIYNNNIFGQSNAGNINALAFTGSTFNVNDNIFKGGQLVLNPASASLAEIAAGVSGSGGGGFEVVRNMTLGTGGMVINVGPQSRTNFNSYVGNLINGGVLTITNISSSLNVNAGNNNVNQAQTYTNAGAANLGIHRQPGNMSNNYGGMNLIASASAISATTNISTQALIVTNRMYSGSVIGSGSLIYGNNINNGGGNTYTITGSFGGTGNLGMSNNIVNGGTNTIFTNVEGRGNYVGFTSNVIGGQNLILTGSNNTAITASGGAYFGRFNADDGIRNQSAENIFFVGTGTSASNRKTGFLIDSGSNIYAEGTFNVSGSTRLSGSLFIQSGSTFPTQIGTTLVTYDATTGQVGQATTATLISSSFSAGEFYSMTTLSGSGGVSASIDLPNTAISNGVSIQNNSQITVQNTGTYNIQFSAQCDAFSGADTIWIWFKKNGTNISDSASKLIMQNNTANLMTVNIFDNAVPNDYFEVVWQNNGGSARIISDAATGNIPAIPSVIVTVNQVK